MTLVALGPDNADTRWVDLEADGSFRGPSSLTFAMEAVTSHRDRLVLSGNEPGSDEAAVITVAPDGTVVARTVLNRSPADGGVLTRWPVPVPASAQPALVWESSEGLFWSAPPSATRRISGPAETDALAVAGADDGSRALVARTTVHGGVEVWQPSRGEWTRLGLEGWANAVAATATGDGWVVAAGVRGEHRVAVFVLNEDHRVAADRSVDPPGHGPVLSASVRVASTGSSVIVSTFRRSRSRGAGGTASTADAHAVTALERDPRASSVPDWLAIEPAGSLHHAVVANASGLVVVVHGNDSAFVTEALVPE
jgi:hypothetical protein